MKKSTIYSQKWQRANPWKHKYIQAKSNAKLRDIPFLMTFEEWCLLWRESGKWEQRGWRRGQYCMARFGDQGAYEIGNVKICLAEENRAERNQNYPMKGERNPAHGKGGYWENAPEEKKQRIRAAISLVHKGKPKPPEQRAKMSAAAYGPRALEQRRQMSITARTRRAVIRDGRRVWAHPGDTDYPVSAV